MLGTTKDCQVSLKTLRKLDSAKAHVYTILNKLGPVRQVLTQKDDLWESWGLVDSKTQSLVQTLPSPYTRIRELVRPCLQAACMLGHIPVAWLHQWVLALH